MIRHKCIYIYFATLVIADPETCIKLEDDHIEDNGNNDNDHTDMPDEEEES